MFTLLKHWRRAEIDFSKHFYGNVGSLNIPQGNQGIFNHREERQREVKRAATFDVDPVRANLAWMVGAKGPKYPSKGPASLMRSLSENPSPFPSGQHRQNNYLPNLTCHM